MITYQKFFELITQMGLSQNELIRQGIINPRLLNAIKNNKSITIDSLNTLCNRLKCTPFDIIEYVPDESNSENN